MIFGPEAIHKDALTTLIAELTRMTNLGAQFIGRQKNIQILNLSFNSLIGDWGFLSELHCITDLNLSLNFQVDDAVVELIANNMPHLQHLWLSKTGITNASAPHFARLSKLQLLSLGKDDVGDEVVEAVADLPQLHTLFLDYTGITSDAAFSIIKMKSLKNLKLTGCEGFADQGIMMLATEPNHCDSLIALNIGGSQITNECITALQQLTALQSLQLWETNVTSVGAKRLIRPHRLIVDDQIRCQVGTWIFADPRRLY